MRAAMTPQQQLEHACKILDPVLARKALAAGALAAQADTDDCPLSIAILRACPASTQAPARAALLELLFAAGAPWDPRWAEDVEITSSAGLEILFDQATSRSAQGDWSTQDELRVLEAWLAAGNSPNPPVMVDGRLRHALDLLSLMLENMKESAMGEAETANALDFLRGSAAILAAAQDPMVRGPLVRAHFEPEEIARILAQHAKLQSQHQEDSLEKGTAPAPRRGAPLPRL